MAGTHAGGKKSAAKNTQFDADFYKKIGAKGGSISRHGGFFKNRELAREVGAIGGRKSRRGRASK